MPVPPKLDAAAIALLEAGEAPLATAALAPILRTLFLQKFPGAAFLGLSYNVALHPQTRRVLMTRLLGLLVPQLPYPEGFPSTHLFAADVRVLSSSNVRRTVGYRALRFLEFVLAIFGSNSELDRIFI